MVSLVRYLDTLLYRSKICKVSILRRAYAKLRSRCKRNILIQLDKGYMMLLPCEAVALALTMACGLYEKLTSSIVKRLLRPGHVFVDVGASFGYYTVLAAGIVGPHGKVIAFEPEPTRFVFLKTNIKINRLSHVIAVNVAVSNINGEAYFYINGEESSLYVRHGPRIRVRTVRLDEFLESIGINSVNMVKIDVEGAEMLVLEGAEKVFERSKNLRLIIELNPQALRAAKVHPYDLIEKIKRLGAKKIYVIMEHKHEIAVLRKDVEDYAFTHTVNLLCLF